VRAVETHGWDGDWYLRAFYDDGAPLGSSQNSECRIDSIAQSWAVFSGAGDPARARRAMASVKEKLVRHEDRLILLFTPPFDKTPRDPGYIRGYPPGVRENGGQYTHAAIWAAWAFAEMGDGNTAGELFSLLNPVHQAADPESVQRYMVEPYVVAADIYSAPPHVGRGGWTWYTGSSGWLYRLGLEAILGVRTSGDGLRLDPCIPSDWPGFQVDFRSGDSVYRIEVRNPAGVCRGIRSITLDGETLPANVVPIVPDGEEHEVIVEMGRAALHQQWGYSPIDRDEIQD
jgi:cyclic beta-1,2-glucan synthetase